MLLFIVSALRSTFLCHFILDLQPYLLTDALLQEQTQPFHLSQVWHDFPSFYNLFFCLLSPLEYPNL